ncbi:MAG: hypothetical protein ACREKB_05435, partial [Candidatus Rokuibacteriota bacterium]
REGIRVAVEVGRLHAALAVAGGRLLVPDEPAMERLLRRLQVGPGPVPTSRSTPGRRARLTEAAWKAGVTSRTAWSMVTVPNTERDSTLGMAETARQR